MGSIAAHDIPAPDGALIARFLADLFQVWPEGENDVSANLGLAVSGGPDSTALLLLASAALPGRVEAATVDHNLRPEAADEAALVAGLSERLGIPHRTLKVDVPPGNIQANARAARYGAMDSWLAEHRLSALATAHHADDQAETLLLRLNRASGVSGLAATRARGRVPGSERPLLRPLLGWRRSELVEIVQAAGIEAVQDPSNLDDRFDRVRMRKALAGTDWLDIAAIAESASHLAEADAALEWAARREWAECVSRQPLGMSYRPQAPRAVALRVISRIVEDLGGESPRGSAVARVFDSLVAGSPASIGDLVARPDVKQWCFTKAPKRRAKS